MSERKGTKALELWCKRLIKDCPDIKIENMTTSWRNGMAFCALVHHFRPDLIDISKLKPENIYENNQLAFSVAEKHLGIPALLDPEDMVENDVPDRLSILTYLSQFYQRLGHTVNTKASESESKSSTSTESVSQIAAPIQFGRTGLDKCTACGLPVYLAQRLMVSHKLYHRRCFRCSKCAGHLNPKNYHVIEGSELLCDSCKNEKSLFKYLNNNDHDHDQMGMLAFSDNNADSNLDVLKDEIKPKPISRPSSVLEKINMFEKNDKESSISSKVSNISITDSTNNIELSSNGESLTGDTKHKTNDIHMDVKMENIPVLIPKSPPEKVYKSNLDKFNFLQTQLSGDSISHVDKTAQMDNDIRHKNEDCLTHKQENPGIIYSNNNNKDSFDNDINHKDTVIKEELNITDDIRISKIPQAVSDSVAVVTPPVIKEPLEDTKRSELPEIANLSIEESKQESNNNLLIDDKLATNLDATEEKVPSAENTSRTEEIKISVPPRRKKQNAAEKSTNAIVAKKETPKPAPKEYPDHLNPFSDDEDEEEQTKESVKKESTNPFGSSDEEDDEVPPIQPPPKVPGIETSTPVKRLIAVNPFWSDGEEPSTDEEEEHSRSSKGTYSSLATSTPNLLGSTLRRKKPRAPLPPAITVSETPRSHATSMDDVASISSLSSFNSTAHSDQKSYERSTPRLKKRPAPTPPESLSGYGGSIEKSVDSTETKNSSVFDSGKKKGPAPGLPLPERREVKLQMSAEELQVQLDLLETQQLGLERQGVLIERMIRDKCEGDEATTVPQEEVEDLVIQLCELVNEKNDLFRKQTELMYIRRQQRLEQEQADIEHEIRIIQSRPAVNRIDADKAREEQLVSRLVQIVRMRDELVQQLDAERRRERQEDLAIAASIATKRAQRNSDSNSSSMKSGEAATATPKKNKVKDKVKKQFKKAKHTLIPKKKDDSERKEVKDKEEKMEKEKKSK